MSGVERRRLDRRRVHRADVRRQLPATSAAAAPAATGGERSAMPVADVGLDRRHRTATWDDRRRRRVAPTAAASCRRGRAASSNTERRAGDVRARRRLALRVTGRGATARLRSRRARRGAAVVRAAAAAATRRGERLGLASGSRTGSGCSTGGGARTAPARGRDGVASRGGGGGWGVVRAAAWSAADGARGTGWAALRRAVDRMRPGLDQGDLGLRSPSRASAPPRSKWKPERLPPRSVAERRPPPSVTGLQFRRGRPPIASYTVSLSASVGAALNMSRTFAGLGLSL